jgi:hypothetical protein
MFRRTFPAGAAETWVAMTLRGDDPQERRSQRRSKGTLVWDWIPIGVCGATAAKS